MLTYVVCLQVVDEIRAVRAQAEVGTRNVSAVGQVVGPALGPIPENAEMLQEQQDQPSRVMVGDAPLTAPAGIEPTASHRLSHTGPSWQSSTEPRNGRAYLAGESVEIKASMH